MDNSSLLLLVPVVLAALIVLAYVFCKQLLPLADAIDWLNTKLGVIADWLVLLACLVSAGNAIFRYALTPIIALGSDPNYKAFHGFLNLFTPIIDWYGKNANGFLELQWYMFAGIVLLGAPYTMLRNEHVRVDLFYGAVSDRTRHWIDLFGGVIFLLPMCVLLIWFTWPWFIESWSINEASNNAGGLTRWPVKLLLPVGLGFLLLQGISEIVKRAAALRGYHVHAHAYEKPLQ